MKHLLLLMFILFFGLASKLDAQNEMPYLPTAIEGANWVIRNSEAHQGDYISFVHSVEGDTTIAGRTYKKIYRRIIDHIQVVSTDPPLVRPYSVFPGKELITLLRDEIEERQVFGRIRTLNPNEITFGPDTLLHDYALEVGDTLRGVNFDDFHGPSIITEIRFESRFGEIRRVQIVNDHKYYEGVGSQVWGPVSGPSMLVAMGIFNMRDYCLGSLEDCRVWLTPVTNLSVDSSIKTYPNPFINQLNIAPTESQTVYLIHVSLRDMTGRIVRQGELGAGLQWSTEDLNPGMYTATFTSGVRNVTVKLIKH